MDRRLYRNFNKLVASISPEEISTKRLCTGKLDMCKSISYSIALDARSPLMERWSGLQVYCVARDWGNQ